MGSWDCYCSICGGPLRAQSVREKHDDAGRASTGVRQKSARHDGADGEDADEDEGEEQEGEDSNRPHETAAESEDEGDDGVSDSGSMNDDNEEEDDDDDDGYDPRIVQPKDLEWTGDCRVLGINGKASDLSKAFVSGLGHYSDYGWMDCRNGNDPNAEGVDMENLVCYSDISEGDDERVVFPFHWDCYKLLCRYITGSEDTESIDKDILHKTMCSLTSEFGCRLNLDYDEPNTMINHEIIDGQFWEVKNGEELYVISPLAGAPLSPRETARLQQATGLASLDSSMATKVISDPFSRFPAEILDQIVSDLGHQDLMNLLKASWCIHSAYHGNNPFWSRRIRNTMAWFFELHEVMDSPTLAEKLTSMKAVYLWAWTKTKPRFKRKGKYMGTSNRRRIWATCAQLAEIYQDILSKPATEVDDATGAEEDSPSLSLASDVTATEMEGG
ncbi:unnamed protein product, partial [Clonostachys rosea]